MLTPRTRLNVIDIAVFNQQPDHIAGPLAARLAVPPPARVDPLSRTRDRADLFQPDQPPPDCIGGQLAIISELLDPDETEAIPVDIERQRSQDALGMVIAKPEISRPGVSLIGGDAAGAPF